MVNAGCNARSVSRYLRRGGVSVALALLMIAIGLFHTGQARAGATVRADVDATERPYLGALLDWATDSTAAHSDRLGVSAAIYGRTVPLPMSEQEQGYLRSYFGQVSSQGTHALLTIRPGVPLDQVDDANASVLAAQVADVAEGYGGSIFVRFAPQMNASWTSWGQQPEAYIEAFRAVTAAFDDELVDPVMVWSPTAAQDYPFRPPSTTAPGGNPLGALDTDGNGTWDFNDDAYSPYYPGDDVVDWVGLTAYHDETGDGPAHNSVPAQGSFEAMLGAASTADPPSDEDFYASYVLGPDKSLMVETGAFYSPGAAPDIEDEIKGVWSAQVLTATSSEKYSRIGAVVWNETIEQRNEGTVTVDWRITADPVIASAFAARVEDSAVVTGAVIEQSTLPGVASAAVGTSLQSSAAWFAASAALGIALLLCLLPALQPVKNWAYEGASSRDARIDMLRGVAIVFVVVNHVGLTSLFQLLTQETIGVVSGAELFVLLSGAVLGMVYGPRVRHQLGDVVDRTSKRAWKLYVTALSVVLLVFLLSQLPFLDATAVTTFTDQGTGAAGTGAAGTTYDLYAGMGGLLQFPVSAHLIPALLLLQVGPWQFNVMGLYVIFLALSPVVLAALARGRAWLVLLISLGLYAIGTTTRFRVLPSQFEDSFPLLVWQVLFVLGMVAGYYRAQIVNWFSAPTRRLLLWACVLLTVALAIFSWSSPYFTNAYDLRLSLLPDATFRAVYDSFFGRTYLGPGRLANVLLVIISGYALLSAYWKPLQRSVGWFLIPLGQATLYVFILHVFLILAAANVPALQHGNIWINTAAYVAILGLLWVMVRTEFLFRIIPR